MKKLIDWVFHPPKYASFVDSQRSNFLHNSLLISTAASILIGLINLVTGAYLVVAILAVLALYGIFGIWLNRRGQLSLAAWLLILLVYGAIITNMIDGAGLHDPAIAGLPLLILLISVLVNRTWILAGAVLSSVSLYLVYFIDQSGLKQLAYEPTLERVIILSILLAATSLVLWLYSGSWQQNINVLSESYKQTLESWVLALEYKDPTSSVHAREVVDISVTLAEAVGLPAVEIDHIRRGALLHDIGKIAVPDNVLSKPGPLDEAEWEIMKKHPQFSQEFLKGIAFLAPAMSIPFSHHERWDGKGYPLGLQSEEIPLPARIFTIVDVWHALGENRPYRKAWPEERITEYLEQNAGRIFDPAVLNVFLELIRTNRITRTQDNQEH